MVDDQTERADLSDWSRLCSGVGARHGPQSTLRGRVTQRLLRLHQCLWLVVLVGQEGRTGDGAGGQPGHGKDRSSALRHWSARGYCHDRAVVPLHERPTGHPQLHHDDPEFHCHVDERTQAGGELVDLAAGERAERGAVFFTGHLSLRAALCGLSGDGGAGLS